MARHSPVRRGRSGYGRAYRGQVGRRRRRGDHPMEAITPSEVREAQRGVERLRRRIRSDREFRRTRRRTQPGFVEFQPGTYETKVPLRKQRRAWDRRTQSRSKTIYARGRARRKREWAYRRHQAEKRQLASEMERGVLSPGQSLGRRLSLHYTQPEHGVRTKFDDSGRLKSFKWSSLDKATGRLRVGSRPRSRRREREKRERSRELPW